MIYNHFADIILPFAIKEKFTYGIPGDLKEATITGIRVLVQLGNRKLYSGIVSSVHNNPPKAGNIRPLLKIIDKTPLVNEKQLKFWDWISEYYMCFPGEVMKAALPSALFLEGEKTLPVAEKY